MNIIVCVKQVPMNNDAKVDPVSGVMIRSSADTKLNPYDLFAVETALRLASDGDKVTAVTMGPLSAANALRECVYMGADNGVLLSDRAFAGSDVLATSYALSQAISTLEYDMIICGKQTTDGDTAQVGAELSQWLKLPVVANVTDIQRQNERSMITTSNLGDYLQTNEITLPAVICVEKDIFTPRLPSFNRKRKVAENIVTLTVKDLPDKEVNHYGLKGSPTQVERIFPPQLRKEKIIFSAKDADGKLAQLLKDKKII